MTDDDLKKGYDPANTSPAEGQSHAIPEQARGQDPDIDPADKDKAEGDRGDGDDGSTPGRD